MLRLIFNKIVEVFVLLSVICLVVGECKLLFIHKVQCLGESCINKLDTISNFLLQEKRDNMKLLSERIYAKNLNL